MSKRRKVKAVEPTSEPIEAVEQWPDEGDRPAPDEWAADDAAWEAPGDDDWCQVDSRSRRG